jgi:excisionase family DNA binding protein
MDDMSEQQDCNQSLMTKSQLAETLKLSKRSIDRHIAEGKLPSGFLLGGARRWSRSEIDEWIACGCPVVDR